MSLLEIIDLKKYFPVQRTFVERLLAGRVDYIKAVDGVSFSINKGEVFCVVGESGCGKTTLGKLTIRLIEPSEGKIFFDGVDITKLKGEEMRRLRRRMQIIFQDPYASLNPRMKVGDAIGHALEIHKIAFGEQKRKIVLEMLEKVGLSPPEQFYDKYPHQLSGGQRQRVAIARALVLNPDYIVADEPTSMLDVSVQAGILNLMLKLKRELGLTYLFITHDLAVASYMADRIAVMYLGKFVEVASKRELLVNPMHPYTKALLSAIPIADPDRKIGEIPIRGVVPSPINIPSGCRFHPRCPYAKERCRKEEPPLIEVSPNHFVACRFFNELKGTGVQ